MNCTSYLTVFQKQNFNKNNFKFRGIQQIRFFKLLCPFTPQEGHSELQAGQPHLHPRKDDGATNSRGLH